MATAAGRIICRQCGANNFATQAACWKCGTALSAAPPSARPVAPPSSGPMPVAPVSMSAPLPDNSLPDPGVAVWAAIALALFFPYIAVPAGIIFLMLDDRRKIEIGKMALIWGIIATIVHTLITFWLINSTVQQSMAIYQSLLRARAAASGESSGPISLPGMSTTPNARQLPNTPPMVPSTEYVPFPDAPTNIPGK